MQHTQDGRLVVEYYSVERYEASAELRIRFQPVQTEDGLIRLALSREFTDATTPEAITPAPDSVEMRDDRIVYAFRAADLGKEGSKVLKDRLSRERIDTSDILEAAREQLG